ncbi:hypothetical protein [Pedobacter soli]|nr:hypothetical protein [Pedobacter soli]
MMAINILSICFGNKFIVIIFGNKYFAKMLEHTLYNPASQSKSSLIDAFVVRTKIFSEIFEIISKEDLVGDQRHYLLQGQRGMGKTTLLLRLKYEIENTESLRSWLLPIFFNEESYDLTSLSGLWEKMLKYLDEYWDTNGLYYGHTELFLDSDDYEEKCFNYLLEILTTRKKKLILFFDNFTQLFLDNLTEKEKKRFEQILGSCDMIRIVAASAIVVTNQKNYAEPLFKHFRIIPLVGLTREETLELLSSLSEKGNVKIDLVKNKAKLETLAVLTGGVIRTLMLVYEVVLADQDGSALTDLQLVLDRVTPLYKHRIEDLPVQQRRIIDVVAKQWDAMSTKDIAVHLRDDGRSISTKLISAQLQQLEKNNVIDKKETSTKNNLYQLKERFFNIWYLMRHGDRKDRRKVIWLTRFLELWYEDEKGFEVFLKRHIKLLKSGKYHAKSAILLTEALIGSKHLDILSLNKLYVATSAILTEEQRKELPDLTGKQLFGAMELYRNKDYSGAIDLLNAIEHPDQSRDILLAWNYAALGDRDRAFGVIESIETENETQTFLLSTFYQLVNDDERAQKCIDDLDHTRDDRVLEAKANFYISLDKVEKAKALYMERLNEKDSNSIGMLVDFLMQQQDYEEAEKYILLGMKVDDGFTRPLLDLYLMKDNSDESKIKALTILKENDEKFSSDPEFLVYKGLSKIFAPKDYDEHLLGDFDEMQVLEDARKMFVKGNKHGYEYYLLYYFLLMLYTEIRPSKKKATRLIEEIDDSEHNPYFILKNAFILAWNGNYSSSVEVFIKNQRNVDFEGENDQRLVSDVIMLLVLRGRYEEVATIFDSVNNLKDILKPLYFAFLDLSGQKDANEYLKMGKELEQPVKDVMAKIGKMAKTYKLN